MSNYLRLNKPLSLSLVVRLIAFVALALVMLWAVNVGQASSTILVNTFEDVKQSSDGLCSLREAIIAANSDKASGGKPGECVAGDGADTIFLPAGTHVLSRSDSGKEDASQTGDLDIAADLTIVGDPGAMIDASGINDRVFHVIEGHVQISDVTIKGGTVSEDGGGIYNSGVLDLEKIALAGNTADGHGGGIYNEGTLTLINSTVSGNTANTSGGAVYNAGTLALNFVTIADNHVTSEGGGVSNAGSGTVDFGSTIIAGNDAAGLPSDCSGDFAGSLGYNLVGDGTGCPTDGSTDMTVDPADVFVTVLGPFKFDALVARTTRTHSLLPGSPAIDAIPVAQCSVTIDQRGQPRPQDGEDGEGRFGCDIGAYEAGIENITWPTALELTLDETGLAAIDQYLTMPGQARWYKFKVEPDSRVIVTLTNLPANYNLFLFKDVAAAFNAFATVDDTQDLTRLDAEFAPDIFSPDIFSPDIFSPDIFSPDIFSPDIFSPDIFSPDIFSPDIFSPDIFSPDIFSPDIFSPDIFSPDIFSPDIFSPDIFSQAFTSAQTRSLIGVSAFPGTAGEGIGINTWNNDGYYYVRVSGNNGVFSLDPPPFHVQIQQQSGGCQDVQPITSGWSITGEAGGYKTIILTDLDRMEGDTAALQTRLDELALDVDGVVVDLGAAGNRVQVANTQAGMHVQCPYAKNLVAAEIKSVIDSYWELNPLEYVVIVGNDNVIPSWRYSDQAGLANENNYIPPVLDNTPSQASLRKGYVLSQDAYGARTHISFKNEVFPIPELGVGRLVETPDQIITVIDAYLDPEFGGVVNPQSALTTGYDFLFESTSAISTELGLGLGSPGAVDFELLTPAGPTDTGDPTVWNADQLRQKLLGGPDGTGTNAHDLIFLAGHFSASSALAADYDTRMVTQEVIDSSIDMSNVIIFSVGCHAGYNIVDIHDVPGITREPDWAQAFASKGATLVAGSGYQYGHTDFIKYSERLYLLFSQELRAGEGPVSVGNALVEAKLEYLATTPQMRGIDQKALLEASIFGLPMLSVDMPGEPNELTGDTAAVAPTPFTLDPGDTLGLYYADISVTPNWGPDSLQWVTLIDPGSGDTYEATYLIGGDGVVSGPGEPTLPLEVFNATPPIDPATGNPLWALRGVGFRSGVFEDIDTIAGLPVLPLIGVATTEVSGPHSAFSSSSFYPVQPWDVNYFDAFSDGGPRLMVTPAQYRAVEPGSRYSILRQFSDMDFRLYYSDYTTFFSDGEGNVFASPAQAAPPTIVRVSAVPNADGTVSFSIRVVGDPSAGIQEVWVTYTAENGPLAGQWQSLDLVQDPTDSTQWMGTLDLDGTESQDVRYLVQAANGVGLVTMLTNQGFFYVPGLDPDAGAPTTLTLDETAPTSGVYGSEVTLQAMLATEDGTPLAGEAVSFRLAGQTRIGITDGDGLAAVEMPLLGFPGTYEVRATFRGSFDYAASSAENSFQFTVEPQTPSLTLETVDGYADEDALITVTLRDSIRDLRLPEMTVFVVIDGDGGSFIVADITTLFGEVTVDEIPLPIGTYGVTAWFADSIPPSGNIADATVSDARYNPAMATGTLELLNHPPTDFGLDSTSVPENAPVGTVVGTFFTTDPDAGDSHSYQFVDGDNDNALFTIDGDALKTDAIFDFEAQDTYYIQVKSTDTSGAFIEKDFTINVLDVNDPPICSGATPSPQFIWSPDKDFWPISLLDITDSEGDEITITILGIFQDEPVGNGGNSPDGMGVGTDTAEVRAERDGNGDGRVYHVEFRADDGFGFCTGMLRIAVVAHDQGSEPEIDAIDQGPLYDSTMPD